MNLKLYNQDNYDRGKNPFIVIIWDIVKRTFFRASLHNMYRYRALLLKMFGCKLGTNVRIRRTCDITYPWKVSIGDNTWIDEEVIIYSLDKIEIGHDCSISRRSFLCTGSHDYTKESFDLLTGPIKIGSSVWIQSEVFIARNVIIGDNTVIGVKSLVTKDQPCKYYCYGQPCKPKKRIL
jgi:putative colanic acid biosynthesis acetyltransferase WcaF